MIDFRKILENFIENVGKLDVKNVFEIFNLNCLLFIPCVFITSKDSLIFILYFFFPMFLFPVL